MIAQTQIYLWTDRSIATSAIEISTLQCTYSKCTMVYEYPNLRYVTKRNATIKR